MKILIREFDLFGAIGGGQTSYGKLIRANPENIYYIFSRNTDIGTAEIPHNAKIIPFKVRYTGSHAKVPDSLEHLYGRYLVASQFAAAVREHLGATHFDVVDTPDYETDGLFIRSAMAAHDITVGCMALALHGTISSALDGDWDPGKVSATLRHELAVLEDAQYRVADVRYALSETYGKLWHSATGRPFRPLDPLHITGDFRRADVVPAPSGSERPSVYFIGRREKRKGPDLFVDLLWAVGASHYNQACIVGQESTGFSGEGSEARISTMLRHRNMVVHDLPAIGFAELEAIFRGRNIILLPSRYDQFNLIALEALRLGCPVFVSRQAGAAHWIETHYPELADLVIDIGCDRAAATRIRDALRDYDGLRARIAAAIAAKPIHAASDDLSLIYEPYGDRDMLLQMQYRRLGDYFQRNFPLREIEPVSPTAPTATQVFEPAPAVSAAVAPPDTLYPSGRQQLSIMEGMEPSFALTARRGIPHDPTEIDAAIGTLVEILNRQRTGRVAVFDRLARLEHARGRHLTAALYDLRVMRWLGADPLRRLGSVIETFRAEGFAAEAETVAAMYADPLSARTRCAALMAEQFARNRQILQRPLESFDDRRGVARPKVAVIVSLYDAHTKLPTLLANLAAQTMAREGQVEVVLVDSGSPGQERAVFAALADQFTMPMVYARSASRETIQSAWNRGILLSRADYLCFLGVDEGMHPECLEVLSGVLDDDAAVDWAMADSVITEVTMDGIYTRDVMRYARTGCCPTLVYLETCYLSWVGGLYRRSVHTRFGYYDERFSAAGDTEFKSRILKHINIAHVARTYGIFNNYPEERTTQHPRAEIEDQRAWYLYRSEAGVDYLYEHADNEQLLAALRHCMGYQKSYLNYRSTDFDFARSLAVCLARRNGENAENAEAALDLTERLLRQVRRMECVDAAIPISARAGTVAEALGAVRELESVAANLLSLPERPRFEVFNDNRFEQHWWSWSG